MGKKSKKSHKKKQKTLSKSCEGRIVNVEAAYQTGLDYFKNSAYHSAVIEWKKIADDKNYAVSLPSLLAEACYRKGLQLYQQLINGDRDKIFNQVIAAFSQAVNLQPNKSIYHYHLGLAFFRFGNYKKAIFSYKKALDIDKNDRYLRHLVLAYFKQGNVVEANNYKQLLKKNNAFLSTIISIISSEDETIPELDFNKESKEKLFLMGLISLKLNKCELAKEYSQTALELESSYKNKAASSHISGYLYYLLALIEQRKNPEQAEQYWQKILTLNLSSEHLKKNLSIYYFNKGLELAQQGKFKSALAPLDNAKKLQPNNEVITKNINLTKFLYANHVARQGIIQEALKLWHSTSIKKDINRIINIALALDKLDQPQEANYQWTKVIEYWRKEYKSKSDDRLKGYLITAHKHLAENYLKIDNERRAIKEFENVIHYTPDDAELRTRLGELLMENGRWNSAIKQFRTILNLKPDDTDALFNIAFLYDQAYEQEKAIAVLENILSIDPNNSHAKQKMGGIFHDQAHEEWDDGDYNEAAKLFLQQIKIDPKKFSGYACLSDLYFETRRKKEVDNLLNYFIRTDPDNPDAYLQVAKKYYEYGSKGKAGKYLKKAEQLNPNDCQLLIEIGKTIFFESPQKAKGYFNKALTMGKDIYELYREIGTWIGPYDPKTAIAYLQKYLTKDRRNVAVLFELSMLYNLIGNKRDSEKAHSMAIKYEQQQENEEISEDDKYKDIEHDEISGDQLSLF